MEREEIILKELSLLARQLFATGGGEVYLYGSRAKGNAMINSDWDVLIVTDDELITNDVFDSFALPFAEIGWHYGEQITPIHFTRSQWNAESSTAFYHNVVSTRIRL